MGKVKDTRARFEDFAPGTLVAGKLRCAYCKIWGLVTDFDLKPIYSINVHDSVIAHATVIKTDKATELVAVRLTDAWISAINKDLQRNNSAIQDGIVYIKQNSLYWEELQEEDQQEEKNNNLLKYGAIALIGYGLLK